MTVSPTARCAAAAGDDADGSTAAAMRTSLDDIVRSAGPQHWAAAEARCILARRGVDAAANLQWVWDWLTRTRGLPPVAAAAHLLAFVAAGRGCHFAGTPSSSLFETPADGRGGCSRLTVSPAARRLRQRHRVAVPRLSAHGRSLRPTTCSLRCSDWVVVIPATWK